MEDLCLCLGDSSSCSFFTRHLDFSGGSIGVPWYFSMGPAGLSSQNVSLLPVVLLFVSPFRSVEKILYVRISFVSVATESSALILW